jgi:hypothetical protein
MFFKNSCFTLNLTQIISGEEQKLWPSSLCNSLYLPVTSSLLGPNILNLRFCIRVRNQVSRNNRCIWISFGRLWTAWQHASPLPFLLYYFLRNRNSDLLPKFQNVNYTTFPNYTSALSASDRNKHLTSISQNATISLSDPRMHIYMVSTSNSA